MTGGSAENPSVDWGGVGSKVELDDLGSVPRRASPQMKHRSF